MLSNQLVNNNFPTVDPVDKVSTVLHLMNDFDIQHLPVISEERFVGLVGKDELLDADEENTIQTLFPVLIHKAVKVNEHFLGALKIASTNNLTLIPVVDEEMRFTGSISLHELIKASTLFTGAEEPGAIIVLEMERKSYSFGEISRLVETNDAYITQFNTHFENETGLLLVTIRINKNEVSDIIATFQRYEYSIRYFIGEEQYENELRFNYDHLMSYLKV